jgi:peptide/nickel transport system permease protein
MGRYLVTRITNAVLVLFIVMTVVFLILRFAPGGPAILMADDITQEQADAIRARLGLDEPVYVQYARWLGSLAQGDLGTSFSSRRPVTNMVFERLPATLLLGTSALVISLVVSIPIGIMSAVRRNSIFDYLATFVSFFGVSMPVFWIGLMAILVFSVMLGWFPSAGMQAAGGGDLLNRLHHLVLPSVVLALPTTAEFTRYARSSMLEVLAQDYVRTARSKGLNERLVMIRHAFRNALVTNISVIGVSLPRLVGGAALTEFIFAWPGMGRLAVTSALGRDYPVVMGVTIVVAVVVVTANLLVDLLYPVLDPRIKLTGRA